MVNYIFLTLNSQGLKLLNKEAKNDMDLRYGITKTASDSSYKLNPVVQVNSSLIPDSIA